jgi:hypothetical protein
MNTYRWYMQIRMASSSVRADIYCQTPNNMPLASNGEIVPISHSITALTIGYVVVGVCALLSIPFVMISHYILQTRLNHAQDENIEAAVSLRGKELVNVARPEPPKPPRTSFTVRDAKGRSLMHWNPAKFVRVPSMVRSKRSPPSSTPGCSPISPPRSHSHHPFSSLQVSERKKLSADDVIIPKPRSPSENLPIPQTDELLMPEEGVRFEAKASNSPRRYFCSS